MQLSRQATCCTKTAAVPAVRGVGGGTQDKLCHIVGEGSVLCGPELDITPLQPLYNRGQRKSFQLPCTNASRQRELLLWRVGTLILPLQLQRHVHGRPSARHLPHRLPQPVLQEQPPLESLYSWRPSSSISQNAENSPVNGTVVALIGKPNASSPFKEPAISLQACWRFLSRPRRQNDNWTKMCCAVVCGGCGERPGEAEIWGRVNSFVL